MTTQTQQKTLKKTSSTTRTRKTVARDTTSTQTLDLAPNPFQSEILELASKQRTNAKKEEVLVKYRNPALVSILIWNFDDSIISLLPEGEVPFADFTEMVLNKGTMTDKLSAEINGNMDKITYNGLDERANAEKTSLRAQFTQLNYFIAGKKLGVLYNLTQIKRENIFINLLHGLHKEEAMLLCLVKDKKLTDKYKISFDNVKRAYPDIEWGTR